MTLYMEIKPSARMDCESINMLANENGITDSNLSNANKPTSNKQQSTTITKLDPISASSRRSKRFCLTKIPSGREKKDPAHSSTLLPPLQVNNAGGRVATPTKERVMKLLSNPPELTGTKLTTLSDKLATSPNCSISINQEDGTTPIRNEVACRGPAKRRIRSSYGVRLESIRVGIELTMLEDKPHIRHVHSNDEYQPNHNNTAKLAPLSLIHPDHL